MIKQIEQYMKNNLVLPLLFLSIVSISGSYIYISNVFEKTLHDSASLNSKKLIENMRIFQSFLKEEHLKKDSKALKRYLFKNEKSQIKFFDNIDKESKEFDQFELDSISFLSQNPNKFYIKKELIDDRWVFRYAIVDFFTKKGDSTSIGIIEVITQIDPLLIAQQDIKQNVFLIFFSTALLLLFYYSFVAKEREEEIEEIRERHLNMIKRDTYKLTLTSSVFDSAPEGIAVCDEELQVITVNEAFCNITGYSVDESVSQHIVNLKPGIKDEQYFEKIWSEIQNRGHWEGEVVNSRKNGHSYEEILNITAVKNYSNQTTHYLVMFSDKNDPNQTKESIYNLAHYDTLTKIANRSFFQKKLLSTIEETKEHESVALLYFDLDRFKPINDSLGHGIGDQVLSQMTARVKELLEPNDFFARLGGDEFALFFHSSQSSEICEQRAVEKAEDIINSVNRVFDIEDNHLRIGASIGIALYPRDANNMQELMQYADTAMYDAKEGGRNCFVLYYGEIVERVKYRYKIEQELRLAIDNRELTLVYQPILSSSDKIIRGFEVLSRWNHKELGHVSPEIFISVAEERGLIADYTYNILEESCIQVVKWNDLHDESFYLSVNLSPVQFLHSDLVQRIDEILTKTKFEPSNLKLEITENIIINNKDQVLEALNKFHQLGIQICIDDFGTGYSSIGYLRDYPIDYLKIDKSFVEDTPFDKSNKNICSVISSLADNFNIGVIAEGVEKKENMIFLADLGVEFLQGFYFSKGESAEYWDEFFDGYHRSSAIEVKEVCSS
jgi:diguanylate cyclase (GGDEF)-like protein/PAS domain S-box-containing protein